MRESKQLQNHLTSVNDAAANVDMENTLCGFEIDPLTGSGHLFQLFAMIGLPTIPVLVLVTYSTYQLAGTIQKYDQMRSLNDIFPTTDSARRCYNGTYAY